MAARLFGTNGVRGVVNEDMTTDLALQLGKAIGRFFGGAVAIATDTRVSGDMLKSAVSAGLMATGCRVLDLGIVPTPAIQYYVKTHDVAGGVMITASHNPPKFNGIKCIDGDGTEMPREKEEVIEGYYNYECYVNEDVTRTAKFYVPANTVYNQYDYATHQWTRLLDTPIMDGEGMCAYFKGPELGPDDYYHVVWVWRDTPDCSTNHHLSYARSRDLIHWESAGGVPTELPITIADTAFWVDPIPVRGGIINGAEDIGFDHQNRPLVTYYKYDSAGNSQAYVARWRDDRWQIAQLSDWNYRWDFQGYGSLGTFPIKIFPARPQDDGQVRIDYRHSQYGTGYWLVDDASLKIVANEMQSADVDVQNDLAQENPSELRKYPRRALDSGTSLPEDRTYRLEWETYPANRDRKRDGAPVEPSTLRLIEQSR